MDDLELMKPHMPADYIFETHVDQIRRHITLVKRLACCSVCLDVDKQKDPQRFEVTVCADDQPGLFARITGVFAMQGLRVFGARIHTWKNSVAVDVFSLVIDDPRRVTPLFWNKIRRELETALKASTAFFHLVEKQINQKTGPPPATWHIAIDSDTLQRSALVEVRVAQSFALVHRIARVLTACDANIHQARASTFAGRTVCVFHVRNLSGGKLTDPIVMETIQQSLQQMLRQNQMTERTANAL